MRACRENPRANPNRPDGGDLPNARRGARARSGCGSVASLLPRTNDSRIRARKSGRGQREDRARLLRLQAGESFRTAAHCGVTNDAEGEGQSGATEDADRARRVARQSSSQPTYAALPGNGKAVALPATRPRTALMTAFSDNEIEKILRGSLA